MNTDFHFVVGGRECQHTQAGENGRHERKGRVATAPAVCGCCRRPWYRSSRLEEELRKAVPGRRRRVGADPVAARPCFSPDDRAISRYETGPSSRAERRNQTPSCSLRELFRIPRGHASFKSCWQCGHISITSYLAYRAGVSRFGGVFQGTAIKRHGEPAAGRVVGFLGLGLAERFYAESRPFCAEAR